MAAGDGIKQYWELLLKKPELVVFDYLTAQRLWQKYFSDKGAVHFMGKNSYITFMQAVMMDGVKGTALISYLGEVYQAGSDPAATLGSLLTKLTRKAYVGIREYQEQIKALEKADLGWAWKNGVMYSGAGTIMDTMVAGEEISPSDLL